MALLSPEPDLQRTLLDEFTGITIITDPNTIFTTDCIQIIEQATEETQIIDNDALHQRTLELGDLLTRDLEIEELPL